MQHLHDDYGRCRKEQGRGEMPLQDSLTSERIMELALLLEQGDDYFTKNPVDNPERRTHWNVTAQLNAVVPITTCDNSTVMSITK
jgi:hypothetical protein